MKAIVIVLSAAVGGLRFAVPGHELSLPGTYEAFAHIWVGVLIGGGLWARTHRAVCWWSLAAITAVETAAFMNR